MRYVEIRFEFPVKNCVQTKSVSFQFETEQDFTDQVPLFEKAFHQALNSVEEILALNEQEKEKQSFGKVIDEMKVNRDTQPFLDEK